MKSYIYSISDRTNGKVVYVGSTRDFKRRNREHMRDIEKGVHKIKALNKYKPEELDFNIEYELDTQNSLVIAVMESFVNDLYKPKNKIVIKGFGHNTVTLARINNEEFVKSIIKTIKEYY